MRIPAFLVTTIALNLLATPSANAIYNYCDGTYRNINCETFPGRTIKCYDSTNFNGTLVRHRVDCCADTDCMAHKCSASLATPQLCDFDATHIGVLLPGRRRPRLLQRTSCQSTEHLQCHAQYNRPDRLQLRRR